MDLFDDADLFDERRAESCQEEDFAMLAQLQSDIFAGFGEEHWLQSNRHVLQATPHATPHADYACNGGVNSQPISPTVPASANLPTATPFAGTLTSDKNSTAHLLANDSIATAVDLEEDDPENDEGGAGNTKKAAAKKITTVRKGNKNGKGIRNMIRSDSEAGLQVFTGGLWRPAIFHHELVQRIGRPSLRTEEYRHGRTEGWYGEFDCTSYLSEQREWGEDRADRPEILFEFRKPNRKPFGITPNLKIFDTDINANRVVIDRIYNRSLSYFANLPLTLSSKVEGYLMEAWERQNPAITLDDYFQRMFHVETDPTTGSILKAESQKLTARKNVFRVRARCLSWEKKTYRSVFDQHLFAEVSQNPQWLRANTTRYLNDLDPTTVRNLAQRKLSVRLGGKRSDQTGKDLLELHLDSANSSDDERSLFLAQNGSSLSIPGVSTAVERKRESISRSIESYIDTSTDEGFMSAPAYGTDINLDPNDCRFHVTHSDNDRLQLLWSLHPTIKQFLEALDRETIEIDLTGSYKLAWDKMQSIFVQHTYGRQVDPQVESPFLLTRFEAWTGGIGNFDLGIIEDAVLTYLNGPFITEARDETKRAIFRYLTTEALREKALEARALSAEGSWLDAPHGVRIQLIDGQLTIVEFRLGLRVGRDSGNDEPTE